MAASAASEGDVPSLDLREAEGASLERGRTSREKVFRIVGMRPEAIRTMLARLLS